MTDEHISEAAAVVNQVVGLSAYLHGIGYSVDKFKREIDVEMEHMKSRQREKAGIA
ncbi:MAG: hypothetical protein IBX68_03520 [Dehalococcoidia bacterium]|nr:hypothetical protein [Dehalococcoidia bacterium]